MKRLIKNYASNFNPKGKGVEWWIGLAVNATATALIIPTGGSSLMVKSLITAGMSIGSHAAERGIYHLKKGRLEKMHANNPAILAEKIAELQGRHEKGTRRIRNFFSGMAAGAVLGGGYEMIAFANPDLGLPTIGGSRLGQAITEHTGNLGKKIAENNLPFANGMTVGEAGGQIGNTAVHVYTEGTVQGAVTGIQEHVSPVIHEINEAGSQLQGFVDSHDPTSNIHLPPQVDQARGAVNDFVDKYTGGHKTLAQAARDAIGERIPDHAEEVAKNAATQLYTNTTPEDVVSGVTGIANAGMEKIGDTVAQASKTPIGEGIGNTLGKVGETISDHLPKENPGDHLPGAESIVENAKHEAGNALAANQESIAQSAATQQTKSFFQNMRSFLIRRFG